MNLGAINVHDPRTYRTATQNVEEHQFNDQLSIETGEEGGHTIHIDPNYTPASRQIAANHFGNGIEQAHGASLRSFVFPGNNQTATQGLTANIIRQTSNRTARIQTGTNSIREATSRINELTQGTFINNADLVEINRAITHPQFNLYRFIRSAHNVAAIASQAAITNHADQSVQLLRNLRVLESNIINITNNAHHPGLQGTTLTQHQDMMGRRGTVTNLLNTTQNIVHPNDSTSSDSEG